MTIACVQNGSQGSTTTKSEKHSARSTTTQKITTRNQDGSSRTVTVRTTERYADTTNTVPEAFEVQEIFSNLQSIDRNDRQGPQQPNEQGVGGAAQWVSPRTSTDSQNGNNQGPVLGDRNNPINVDDANTLTIVQGFLSGFMQAQRQSQASDRNTAESTTPTNQPTQQVLSLPNTPAQINMTFHVQPPPPLRAAGVAVSQPSTSYNESGRAQPSVGPPPLSQGFNIAPNQGFQQQGTLPQVIPKPPALQQCPQMQAKAYQSMAQPQTQTQTQPTQQSRPAKRSIPGPPPAPEFFMPKQRRSEPATTVKAPETKESPKPSTSGIKASASPKPSTSGIKPSASPKPSTSGTKASASPKPSTSGTKASASPKPSTSGTKGSASPQPSTSGTKTSASPQPSTNGTKTSAKRGINPQVVASVLAARGITVTPSTRLHSKSKSKSKSKNSSSNPVLNISSEITITRNRSRKNSGKKREMIDDTATTSIPTNIPNAITAAVTSAVATGQRRNCTPIINHNVGRPDRCSTVDLTNDDDQIDIDAPGPSVNRFLCNQCGHMFPTAVSLEQHRSSHGTPRPTLFSCDTCNIQFSTAEDLERHRLDTHRYRARKPNWVIPVVDFEIPGAEQRLVEHGINHFIPISMDGSIGNYAIPIITHSTRRRQRDLLGLSNVIVVGQLRTCFTPRDD